MTQSSLSGKMGPLTALLAEKTLAGTGASGSISGIEWKTVFEKAFQHMVLAHLMRELNHAGPPECPAGVYDEARDLLRRESARSLALSGEMVKLCENFQTKGIHHLVVKGPILAELSGHSAADRHFVDLDFFVKKSDIKKTVKLLTENGYHRRSLLSFKQKAWELKVNSSFEYDNPDTGMEVDIHWAAAPKYLSVNLEIEDLFNRAKQVRFKGKELLTFSSIDYILILSVEGAKLGWKGLKNLCDLSAALKSFSDLDWKKLLLIAKDAGILRIVLISLALTESVFSAELPEEVLEELARDRTAKTAAELCRRELLSGKGIGDLRYALLYIRARERISDRIRYIFYRFTLPCGEDWELCRVPDVLFPLYFVLKPLKTLIRAACSLIKR